MPLPIRHSALAVLLLLAVAATAFKLWPAAPVRLQPDDPALVAQGARIYENNCARCHGGKLEGQPNWRSRLANGRLPAPPQDASGHTWHHTDEVLFRIVKDGMAAVAPPDYQTDMPAFQAVLSDREIIAALSYIKSTWPEEIRRRHDGLNRPAPR